MTKTDKIIHQNKGKKIALYGMCLLDGFREAVARPGSCKAIAKRIGDICREHNVLLFDVRGRDLLVTQTVSYDFNGAIGESRASLIKKINAREFLFLILRDYGFRRKRNVPEGMRRSLMRYMRMC